MIWKVSKLNLVTYLFLSIDEGWSADAVYFTTCLYEGVLAFIREFQGSDLVWWDS